MRMGTHRDSVMLNDRPLREGLERVLQNALVVSRPGFKTTKTRDLQNKRSLK